MNQLSGRLVDEGLGGAKESQGAVGGVHEGRKGGRGGERGGKKSRVEAITNEGVPEFKDDIHVDDLHGFQDIRGEW